MKLSELVAAVALVFAAEPFGNDLKHAQTDDRTADNNFAEVSTSPR
jgi:hypothetical protein